MSIVAAGVIDMFMSSVAPIMGVPDVPIMFIIIVAAASCGQAPCIDIICIIIMSSVGSVVTSCAEDIAAPASRPIAKPLQQIGEPD